MTEQEKAFWDAIGVFEKEGLLPYVMLIGSWAEYLYELHLKSNFKASLMTRDADFLYRNIRRPKERDIRIKNSLKDKGFIYNESRLSEVGKFVKENILELECAFPYSIYNKTHQKIY